MPTERESHRGWGGEREIEAEHPDHGLTPRGREGLLPTARPPLERNLKHIFRTRGYASDGSPPPLRSWVRKVRGDERVCFRRLVRWTMLSMKMGLLPTFRRLDH